MKSVFRYFLASAVVWLVFLAGYVCRSALGDWLVEAHSGSLVDQVALVTSGLFRLFLTFLLVALTLNVCAFLGWGTVALLQECWYQFFQRKIIAILFKNKLGSAEDDDDEDETGDPDFSEKPRKPVSALKHARRPKARQDPERMQKLAEIAAVELENDETERELDEIEIKVARA